MIIQQLNSLTGIQLSQLNELINNCEGYEPFYSQENAAKEGIIQFAAFETADTVANKTLKTIDTTENETTEYNENYSMIGFISCLMTDIENSDGITDLPELTALVAPALRRQGIFTKMLSELKKSLRADIQFITAVAKDFAEHFNASSLNGGFAYAEYLLTCDHYKGSLLKNNICVNNSSDNNCSNNNYCDDNCHYEFYFSDNDENYLMYEGDSDEPIAVCDLNYQPSFTNISGVFVDEALRGKGIGTLFMTNLLKDYFEIYENPLVLNVRSTNTAAVRLYRKCGFTEVSCVDYYYVK